MFPGKISGIVGNKWGRELAMMMAVILVPVFVVTVHNAAIANVAASSQLPPTSGAASYTHSWYITDPPPDGKNTSLADIETLAQKDAAKAIAATECDQGQTSYTILDNGQLSGDGRGVWNLNPSRNSKDSIWTYDQVKQEAQHYIQSWAKNAPPCPLVLALGLNNYVYTSCGNGCNFSLSGQGQIWATMINDLNTWVGTLNLPRSVTVWVADDIETTWDSPSQTLPFVQALLSGLTEPAKLINFGDVRPDPRWSNADLLQVMSGLRIWVLPEMYYAGDIAYWMNFLQANPNALITYAGVLTECSGDDATILANIKSGSVCQAGTDKEYTPSLATQELIRQQQADNIPAVQQDKQLMQVNIRYEYEGLADPATPTGTDSNGCDRVCWADANWNYNYYDDSAGPYSFACDANAYRRGYSTNADTCVDGNVYSATVSASGEYFQPNFQCADFVSRALSQDGLMPGLNNGGSKGHFPASPSVGGYNSYYDIANSKTYYLWNVGGRGNPTGLSDYLLDSGLATNIHQDVSQARPGDPIFFFNSDGIYYHTMIIVGVTNGQLIVDGHNMAQYHAVISASGGDIYHITTTTPGK